MSTTTVNIHEAKTHLSRLLFQVAGGNEIIIAKNGVPVAKLVGLVDRKPRQPGRFRGQMTGAGDNLLRPMPSAEVELWEKGHADDPLRPGGFSSET
ncbi:MAG: type II toxin-antitoxin system prevent-host-death family antitoxin [Terrimicrobiaceae bacterium]